MCMGLTLTSSRKKCWDIQANKIVKSAKIEVAKVGTVSLGRFPQNLSMDFRSPSLTVNVKLALCL